MSDIPADIMKAAEDTLDLMLCECTESCGGTEGLRKDAISKIGAAILAEREKCLSIINEYQGRCLNHRDHAVCMELAMLVRSGGEA